jgi:hypothetical protein
VNESLPEGKGLGSIAFATASSLIKDLSLDSQASSASTLGCQSHRTGTTCEAEELRISLLATCGIYN